DAIFRTVNGAAFWSQASTLLDIEQVGSFAVSPTNPDHVLVGGASEGRIYFSKAALSANSTTVWLYTRPALGWVSSLAFDPIDENRAFATYSTFGVPHVWSSSDGGATWKTSDSGLPDVPFHSIAVDPSGRVYAGSDVGVF